MDSTTVNSINKYLSWFLLALALLGTGAVLTLVRSRIDKSIVALIVMFLAAFILRLPFFWSDDEGENLSFAFATTLVLSIQYYFVFEIRGAQDFIESETDEDLKKR